MDVEGTYRQIQYYLGTARLLFEEGAEQQAMVLLREAERLWQKIHHTQLGAWQRVSNTVQMGKIARGEYVKALIESFRFRGTEGGGKVAVAALRAWPRSTHTTAPPRPPVSGFRGGARPLALDPMMVLQMQRWLMDYLAARYGTEEGKRRWDLHKDYEAWFWVEYFNGHVNYLDPNPNDATYERYLDWRAKNMES